MKRPESSDCSGRGAPAGAAASVMSNVVPGSNWSAGSLDHIETRWLSSRTPARRSIRSRLSPFARVTTISSVGRSGAAPAAEGSGPMRRPLAAPSASSMIICARYSSRTAASRCAAGGLERRSSAERGATAPAEKGPKPRSSACCRYRSRGRASDRECEMARKLVTYARGEAPGSGHHDLVVHDPAAPTLAFTSPE